MAVAAEETCTNALALAVLEAGITRGNWKFYFDLGLKVCTVPITYTFNPTQCWASQISERAFEPLVFVCGAAVATKHQQ